MILSLDLKPLLNDEIIALIVYVMMYLTYYFGSDFPFVKKFLSRYHETKDHIETSVYFRRTMGFVLLGIIPFLVALFVFDRSLMDYGIGFPGGSYAWIWFLVPTALIVLVSIFRSSKGIDTSYYPEVRQEVWTKKRTFFNAFYWAVYLLGYEFAIRGFLFFSILYAYGLWPAIIINSVIYSLIHIFKGRGEAYGAFFLGVLFCLITYYTSSFWIAFVIHVILAVANDVKAVKASSDMSYDFKSIKA